MTTDPWNHINPQRRERLVNVAELRRVTSTPDMIQPESMDQSAQLPEDMLSGDESVASAS